MSTALPPVSLANAVLGTSGSVSFSPTGITAYPGQYSDPPHVQIFNDSGFGLLITMQEEGHSFFMPAGAWRSIAVTPGESGFNFQTIYQMTNPGVNVLMAVYYAPGEILDPIGTLGNSPISGAASTSALPGTAQTWYGSNVADGTIVTDSLMSNALGGTEVQVSITPSGNNKYVEIQSQGGTVASVTAIPTTPTDHGWISRPGAGTYGTANWQMIETFSLTPAGLFVGVTITRRVFRRTAAGVFTLIGSAMVSPSSSAKTVYTYPAFAISAISFAATDILYSDLWYFDPAGVLGDTPNVFSSNNGTAGVNNEVKIITSPFA